MTALKALLLSAKKNGTGLSAGHSHFIWC